MYKVLFSYLILLLFQLILTDISGYNCNAVYSQIIRPSSSLISTSLTNNWQTAGIDDNKLPNSINCINVHKERGIVSPYKDGWKVDVSRLNNLISTRSGNSLNIIYFQEATYYFDKADKIIISKNNIVLSGEGANKTNFIITNISTSIYSGAATFITAKERKNVGVNCLSIDTRNAFPKKYRHNKDYNGKFKNRSIISFNDTENSWVNGVRVHRGYGSTVMINKKGHNEVKNCFFYDHWTIGGTRFGSTNKGGTQGYSVLISQSDYNLIENNKLGMARHNVVIQGSSNNTSNNLKKSDYNVVAYNYCYDGKAKNFGLVQNHPWNITLHGKGKNAKNLIEGNLCEDKIAVDAVHGENGSENTFYRNVSETKIELEDKGKSCQNESQIFILNKVNKRIFYSRYDIRAKHHNIKQNYKCRGNGSGCRSGRYNVGDKCGTWTGNNKNSNFSGSQNGGQSCYLTSIPNFLTSLPINIYTKLPAKNIEDIIDASCYTCDNATLPRNRSMLFKVNQNNVGVKNEKEQELSLEDEVKLALTAYPNPVNDMVTVKLNKRVKGEVSINIYAISGNLIENKSMSLDGQNNINYDLSSFDNGIYIISLVLDDEISSLRIIKK